MAGDVLPVAVCVRFLISDFCLLEKNYLVRMFDEFSENKLASLEATLVRNYDPLNHLITDGGKV